MEWFIILNSSEIVVLLQFYSEKSCVNKSIGYLKKNTSKCCVKMFEVLTRKNILYVLKNIV